MIKVNDLTKHYQDVGRQLSVLQNLNYNSVALEHQVPEIWLRTLWPKGIWSCSDTNSS